MFFNPMPPAVLLSLLFSSGPPPAGVPVPEGHRPFGQPLRADVLKGWETFLADIPPAKDCVDIGQPLVRPLNPPHRDRGVKLLRDRVFRRLSGETAARLLGIRYEKGSALSSQVFSSALEDMRQRKHRAEVERRDSWSLADQKDLERLTARFESGNHKRYRPYLVRAVSKFGDGHGGQPFMVGDLCSGNLHLQTLVFSYTIPPSAKVPTVVFLPQAPKRVYASVYVAW